MLQMVSALLLVPLSGFAGCSAGRYGSVSKDKIRISLLRNAEQIQKNSEKIQMKFRENPNSDLFRGNLV